MGTESNEVSLCAPRGDMKHLHRSRCLLRRTSATLGDRLSAVVFHVVSGEVTGQRSKSQWTTAVFGANKVKCHTFP